MNRDAGEFHLVLEIAHGNISRLTKQTKSYSDLPRNSGGKKQLSKHGRQNTPNKK
jgi:hypothetical protein